MAAISGKDGAVGSYAEVTGWSLNITSNNASYASTSTSGWKKRVQGTSDVTGSVEFKWSGAKLVDAGDIVSGLVLTIDSSDSYTLDAIIDTLNVEADLDDGDFISGSFDFSVTGTTTSAPTGFA